MYEKEFTWIFAIILALFPDSFSLFSQEKIKIIRKGPISKAYHILDLMPDEYMDSGNISLK